MNIVEAGKLIKIMLEIWPNANLRPEVAKHYAEGLADLEYDGLVESVKRLRATEEFLPTVAKLRKGYYGLVGIGNPESAWEQLVSIVKESDIDPYWNKREGLDPVGVAVLGSLGGMPELRFSERPDFLRGEFIRAYERRYADELARPDVVVKALAIGGGDNAIESGQSGSIEAGDK